MHHGRNGFLTAKGLQLQQEAAQRGVDRAHELAVMGMSRYLDIPGSVSGLELERNLFVHDDQYIDSQYRRFLNGS